MTDQPTEPHPAIAAAKPEKATPFTSTKLGSLPPATTTKPTLKPAEKKP